MADFPEPPGLLKPAGKPKPKPHGIPLDEFQQMHGLDPTTNSPPGKPGRGEKPTEPKPKPAAKPIKPPPGPGQLPGNWQDWTPQEKENYIYEFQHGKPAKPKPSSKPKPSAEPPPSAGPPPKGSAKPAPQMTFGGWPPHPTNEVPHPHVGNKPNPPINAYTGQPHGVSKPSRPAVNRPIPKPPPLNAGEIKPPGQVPRQSQKQPGKIKSVRINHQ